MKNAMNNNEKEESQRLMIENSSFKGWAADCLYDKFPEKYVFVHLAQVRKRESGNKVYLLHAEVDGRWYLGRGDSSREAVDAVENEYYAPIFGDKELNAVSLLVE